jgi:uncharacterized protein (UPF0248 family)
MVAHETSAGGTQMTPIHELLNRIRWDAEYAKADFKIGYYDRIEDEIILVSLKRIHFDPEDRFSFELYDDSTELHTVPLHRIRQVYRNGELIWERPSA